MTVIYLFQHASELHKIEARYELESKQAWS